MKLRQIEINNWLSYYGTHTVDIPEGLVLVEGVNLDEEGADSNYSGKSGLLLAVCYANYGKTPLVDKQKDLLNDESKSGYVEATYTAFRVRRYLMDKERGAGPYLMEGEVHKPIDQARLNLLLGLDFDAFCSAVFFGLGYSNFLEMVLEDPGEARELLTRLMPHLQKFDAGQQAAKAKLKDLDSKLQAVAIAEANINGALGQWNKDYTVLIKDWDMQWKFNLQIMQEEVTNLRALKDTQTTTTQAARDMLAALPKVDGKRMQALQEQAQEYSKAAARVTAIIDKLGDLGAEATRLDKEHTRLEGEKGKLVKRRCFTCGAELKDAKVDKLLADKAKELEDNLFARTVNGKETERHNKEHSQAKIKAESLAGASKELQAMTEQQGKIYALQKEVAEKEVSLARIMERLNSKSREARAAEKNPPINPYVEQQKEAQAQIVRLQKDMAALQVERAAVQKQAAYYAFWEKGYGARGIKNYAFDEVIYKLDAMSADYVHQMSNGGFAVRFEPRRELAKGGYEEKMALYVSTATSTRNYYTFSAGQRKRISLCVDLALNDLLGQMFQNPFEWMVLDEVFDSLDALGKERFFKLLEGHLGNHRTVFVITHDESVTGWFDKKIKVEKRNARSRVVQVAGLAGFVVPTAFSQARQAVPRLRRPQGV